MAKNTFHKAPLMKIHTVILLLVTILLSACGGDPTATPPVGDDSQAILEIGELTPVYETVSFDTHKQNNCGGNSVATYTYSQTRSVLHTMTIDSEFTVNTKGEVGIPGTSIELGASLSLRLGQTYGQETSVTRTLELSAIPGTYVEHTIDLQEVWQHGTAKVEFDGEQYEIPFAYRSDFALELVESKELTCPNEIPVTEVYDSFNDNCIDADLWQMGIDSLKDPSELPEPTGTCWAFEPGFTERDALVLEHATGADYQSFSLVAFPKKSISVVEMDINLREITGDWMGIGIFTRLNNADRPWAYYFLQAGDSIGSGYWEANFESQGIKLEDTDLIRIHGSITLTIFWDGEEMKFFVDGEEILEPIPYRGLSDTFGIYWITAPYTSVSATISEIRISTSK